MEKYKIQFDYSKKDIEGKTALLIAIKIVNAPLELIKKLINENTYNNPDNNGVTPLMLAAALGRNDIVQELIAFARKQFSSDIQGLQRFFNAQDKYKWTVAHYVFMPEGSETDKKSEQQHTIFAVLDSIHIVKDRDAKAKANSIDRILEEGNDDSNLDDFFLLARMQKLVEKDKEIKLTYRFEDRRNNSVLANSYNKQVLARNL